MNDKMKTVREALNYAYQIMREHDGDNGGDVKEVGQDIELGSTSFISLKRWIREALAALDSMEAEAHPKAHGEVELKVEDIRELAREAVPPDSTNDGEPWYTDRQAVENTGAFIGIRHITSKYRLIPR